MNELDHHLERCRVCLWLFEDEDIQIKITTMVEDIFLTLTQINVRKIYF